MRIFALCFFLGIACLLQFQNLPGKWFYCLIPLLFLLIYRFNLRSVFTLSIAGFLIGFLWALFRADIILSEGLEKEIEGKKLIIQGVVDSLADRNQHSSIFVFNVKEVNDEAGNSYPVPGRVRLSWYRSNESIAPGEYWQFKVKLKRPYGFMNPGGFDYEYWLFHQNIRATGYVLRGDENQRLNQSSYFSINAFRHVIKMRIQSLLYEKPLGNLITALILGDRSGIQQSQWQILRNTGTSHLMAISGLHIGFIFAVVFFLVRNIVTIHHGLLLYFPAPRLAMVAGLLAAIIYAALAGFSLPTKRALIMLACAVSANLLAKQLPFTIILAVCLLLVLIQDPFAVYTAGFYLSFIAVAIILYGMCHRVGLPGLWWRWGRVQTIVVLGLFPLTIYYFQSIALLSIPANLIAIPVVSLFIVPLSLMAAVFSFLSTEIAALLFHLTHFVFEALWLFLQALSQLDLANWNRTRPTLWSLLFALVGIAILFMPKGLPGRSLALICFLPLFFFHNERPDKGEFWFSLLDVGQGLAAVIQTQNHTLLYDTGAKFSSKFNAGEAVVLPFLFANGINSLDKVIISHGDNDHIGGLDSILDRLPVDEILSSVFIEKTGVTTTPCLAGQHWQWEGIYFEILHPSLDKEQFDENNASCVLKIDQGKTSLLLTGDIEKKAEKYLIQQSSEKLAASVLLLPHHGSKTSSTESFIDTVRPELALSASGYRNRFGFPKKVIMERYRKRGIEPLVSSDSGAIHMIFNNMGLSVTEWRETHRRFWHTAD